MNNFEVIMILNNMSREVRRIKFESRICYIKRGLAIDKIGQ